MRKQRQHGDDRTALDDDVEEIALARQPVLGDEQMAGGGDGNEFGDSLNDSQNDSRNPVRHGVFRRETGAQGKTEVKCGDWFSPTQECLCLLGTLFDFKLAQNGMPFDVDFVPLGFDAAQSAFAHLSKIAEGWRGADEGMDFSLAGRGDLNGSVNHFQFLNDDALDFKKLVFIRRPEFSVAGDIDKMIELLPAFDVSFDLGDELVEFFGGHRWLNGFGRIRRGLWGKENDGATAHFTGGDTQAAKMDAQLGQRHLSFTRLAQ